MPKIYSRAPQEVADMAHEEWRLVVDFPDYQVSNLGRVRSLPRVNPIGKTLSGRVLKNYINEKIGYPVVNLFRDGKPTKWFVHRLVAIGFISNPEGLSEVNHIDGNRGNPDCSNLEWCSHAENLQHAARTGLFRRRKLTLPDAEEIRRLYAAGHQQRPIAKAFGIGQATVFRVCRNEIWKPENYQLTAKEATLQLQPA